MSLKLNIRYFAHSWVSDWNYGSARFLRGLARALGRMGHKVRCYEQLGSNSLTNLMKHEGESAITAIDDFRQAYPELDIHFYKNNSSFQDFAINELREADVVIVHEWNDPWVVNAILALKEQFGFRVLLHDTHHRAYTSPRDILRFQLHLFDGVLAFGEALRRIYADGFGVQRTWTFHGAADVEKFYPASCKQTAEVLWVGDWAGEERLQELREFLIGPAKELSQENCKFAVYGVGYPKAAVMELEAAEIDYRGYLPNTKVPAAYRESALALHIPRRQYTNGLSGTPNLRMFEAMACGTALLCSPWKDEENLFHNGEDFISAGNGEAMKAEIRNLLRDEKARNQLAASGAENIRLRHTCRHRAEQLTEICQELAT